MLHVEDNRIIKFEIQNFFLVHEIESASNRIKYACVQLCASPWILKGWNYIFKLFRGLFDFGFLGRGLLSSH